MEKNLESGLEIQNVTSNCEICKGVGSIPFFDKDGIERWGHCQCTKKRIAESKLRFAEVPEKFRNNKISNFSLDLYKTERGYKEAATAKKQAVEYIKNYAKYKELGKGLYLYSKMPGSGKTRMAVSIGNAIHSKYGDSVRFTTTIDLLDEIKDRFDSKANDEKKQSQLEFKNDLKKVAVLILDDIGTERPTKWVEEIFYSIINARGEGNKVTIFTSNCEIEYLEYEGKLRQRIAKLAIPINFPNESVRMSISRQENEVLYKELLGN